VRLRRRRRHDDVREHFAWLDGRVAIARAIGREQELVQRHASRLSFRIGQLDGSAVRDQRCGRRRGMHHRRPRVVEDRVVLILALVNDGAQVNAVIMEQLVAEVPTARALEQVPANRRGVAQLRCRGMSGGSGKRGVVFDDFRRALDTRQRRESVEHESTTRIERDHIEAGNRPEMDDARGTNDAFSHQVQQIDAAGLGDHRGLGPPLGEKRRGVLDRRRVYPAGTTEIEIRRISRRKISAPS
jgi:hypothetical protein